MQLQMPASSNSLVIPPADVRYRIVNKEHSEEQYTKIGASSVKAILDRVYTFAPSMLDRPAKILDFGCGCARAMQPLHARQPKWDLYGTDIDDVTVEWSRNNLSWGSWTVNAPEPPLHYAPGSFDLIYALSVFSHLNAGMQDRWLAELYRLVKPGGLIYLTFTGQRVLDQVPDAFPESIVRQYRDTGFAYFSNIGDGILPEWYQTSLQTGPYMTSRLPKGAKTLFHEIGGHLGGQDSFVAQKPAGFVDRLLRR